MNQVVVFQLEQEYYGIDITEVQEIQVATQPTPMPFSEYWEEGVVSIRGELYAVINLRKKLSLPTNDEQYSHKFIVLHNQKIALVVNDVEDIAFADESTIHPKPFNFEGNTITCMIESKNRMIPILNIPSLFGTQEQRLVS